jgi:hypothetical protein
LLRPQITGLPQIAGMIMVTIGTVIALWCVFTFVFIGKGTPEAKYELRSKTNQETRKSGKISSCNHEWTRTHTNVRHGFASTDYVRNGYKVTVAQAGWRLLLRPPAQKSC